MRLSHVSEEPDIINFVPRVPSRDELADAAKDSSLHLSMCRMANAKPRPAG